MKYSENHSVWDYIHTHMGYYTLVQTINWLDEYKLSLEYEFDVGISKVILCEIAICGMSV